MFLTNFNFKMIAPSEKRTTIKFHWYKTDKNWFYHWNNNIIVNFDFGNSEMRIELKNKNFGGDYTIEKQISKNNTFTTFLVHKKQNGGTVNFKIKLFNNKKVIVESENSDKILFINGKVIYDGMKFYRFFEEID